MKKLKPVSRIAIGVSAILLVSAYFVPLWQILMWAPQYPEGLDMKIWINNITGDVKIISALNHYIGMKHIEVSMFPEFSYMIYLLAGLIGTGIVASAINRRWAAIVYCVALMSAGVAALVDFYLWGYDYGHNLDPTAAIIVPGMSYQPPLIGTKQLLNFTAYSGPDIGGWIFFASGILAIGGLAFDIFKKSKQRSAAVMAIVASVSVSSCSTEPQPLAYNQDTCHSCKMTLVDRKFGAEAVTKKGKVYKFDDVNCMARFFNDEKINDEDIANLLVVDFSSPEKLIDARNALYIKSPSVKSPMASNIAAFETKGSLDQFNKQWRGILMVWGELQTQFK